MSKKSLLDHFAGEYANDVARILEHEQSKRENQALMKEYLETYLLEEVIPSIEFQFIYRHAPSLVANFSVIQEVLDGDEVFPYHFYYRKEKYELFTHFHSIEINFKNSIDLLDFVREHKVNVQVNAAEKELQNQKNQYEKLKGVLDSIAYDREERELVKTDWDSFEELWADVTQFMQDNPKWKLLPMDNPKYLRAGWTAFFQPENGEEQNKIWTIKLSKLSKEERNKFLSSQLQLDWKT